MRQRNHRSPRALRPRLVSLGRGRADRAGGPALRSLGGAGFTLIELMVVIAIMMILIALIVPSYKAMSAQNERNTCAANLKAIGQALALFREDYGCYPPDMTEFLPLPDDPNKLVPDAGPEPADSIHAAYDDKGDPIDTGLRGRGLYTLFFLGAYSMTLPPASLEPLGRIGSDLRTRIASQRQGLNAFKWYHSAGYITDFKIFHCPANPATLDQNTLARNLDPNNDVAGIPTLGGWNNYDLYYRRNYWDPNRYHVWDPAPMRLPEVNGQVESRHLFQPYPPADTVITWCPYHRHAGAPAGPGVAGDVTAGDKDFVLFADGSVHRMTARQDNRIFEEPKNDAGWPAGPIM